MGKLIEGRWHDVWYDTAQTRGEFVRSSAKFRNWITPDGQGAPTGRAFAAEPDRYHLYVSYACPWAHRTLIVRSLKGLEDMIGLSVVSPFMGSRGWSFEPGPGVIADPAVGAQHLYELYSHADASYGGRVTVPMLWDKRDATIVSNESSEILRMFNSAFDHLGARPGDFYPEPLRPAIDSINERVYSGVNNGVYKCGFATTQQAYEEAFWQLFGTLDELEQRLSKQRYLVGDRLTEADWRLFTTLVRFDSVYVGHFKTNLRRLVDYPNLWAYTRALYQLPGVSATVNMSHIKQHYYQSHASINPTSVVPLGPVVDFNAAHDRDRAFASQRAPLAAE